MVKKVRTARGALYYIAAICNLVAFPFLLLAIGAYAILSLIVAGFFYLSSLSEREVEMEEVDLPVMTIEERKKRK